MTKLEQLINDLCPNGVEYKALWEVTAWDKKFNSVDKSKQKKICKYIYHLASDLKSLESKHGTVKILTTSVTDLWANEEDVKDSISNEEIVCIPCGGNPTVQYYKGKFITGDNRIATSLDKTVLNNKYLYYYLQNRLADISSFYRGSGIKHPDMSKVLELKIPVPPLPVQREIVRILDNFTELTAELTARKKQYEYYRDMLLNFDSVHGGTFECEWRTLGEICTLITKGTTPKAYTKSGVSFIKTECFNGTNIVKEKLSFIDEETHKTILRRSILAENDILITIAGATIGKCAMVSKDILPANTNQALAIIRIANGTLPKFIMYILQSNLMKNYIKKSVKGSAQPNLNLQQLNRFSIPVPPLPVQERIVKVLDNFDAICNDLNIGLPAEINLRKKQYEYYREALLSFDCSYFVNVERDMAQRIN